MAAAVAAAPTIAHGEGGVRARSFICWERTLFTAEMRRAQRIFPTVGLVYYVPDFWGFDPTNILNYGGKGLINF